jgi:uncharacterized protein (DUF952 family)
MSFNIEISYILRTDNYLILERGKTYAFKHSSNQKLSENTPIWLVNTDWAARAEISIMSQTLENNIVEGDFRVDYIYQEDEQKVISNILGRMFSGLNDANIYLLSSQAEYQKALADGKLVRDSLVNEGFIHATPKNQLSRLANKYHKKTIQPLILVVDKKLVSSEVKWEPATGGLYPHIYGALNMSAVTTVENIYPADDGSFHL